MNKKIAFVVVALVALVATFCVSFAGMPLADIDVPTIGSPTGNLYIPRSWAGGTVYIDLFSAPPYRQSIVDSGLKVEFTSPTESITAQYLNPELGWLDAEYFYSGFSVDIYRDDPENSPIFVFIFVNGEGFDMLSEGIFRFMLPDDVVFKVYRNEVDVTAEYLSTSVVPIFGYFMSFEAPPTPSLGETVINNIIDTLWGTVVSVGDSFGEGMNQMVGDLFFDLETGDLSAFSIVIICFFALCLLVTIVNWLFFRLANIKKF